MAYCKLYNNFAAVFNKLKYIVMNIKKLENAPQNQKIDIWCALALLNSYNNLYHYLSYTELRQLEIQRKQINKFFKYDN